MSLINNVYWDTKPFNLKIADCIIYPLLVCQGRFNVEVVNSKDVKIFHVNNPLYIRIACGIISFVISPLILIAFIYKSFNQSLKEKKEIISHFIYDEINALKEGLSDIKDIDKKALFLCYEKPIFEFDIMRDVNKLKIIEKIEEIVMKIEAIDYASFSEIVKETTNDIKNIEDMLDQNILLLIHPYFKRNNLELRIRHCRNKRWFHLRDLKTNLDKEKEKLRSFVNADFSQYTKAQMADLVAYEPVLLPGYYSKELYQITNDIKNDFKLLKTKRSNYLKEEETTYREKKVKLQTLSETFVHNITTRGIRKSDYEGFIKIKRIYNYLKESHFVFVYYNGNDNNISALFSKVLETVSVKLQLKDGIVDGSVLELAHESKFFEEILFTADGNKKFIDGQIITIEKLTVKQFKSLFLTRNDLKTLYSFDIYELYQIFHYLQMSSKINEIEGIIEKEIISLDNFASIAYLAEITNSKNLRTFLEKFLKNEYSKVKNLENKLEEKRWVHSFPVIAFRNIRDSLKAKIRALKKSNVENLPQKICQLGKYESMIEELIKIYYSLNSQQLRIKKEPFKLHRQQSHTFAAASSVEEPKTKNEIDFCYACMRPMFFCEHHNEHFHVRGIHGTISYE